MSLAINSCFWKTTKAKASSKFLIKVSYNLKINIWVLTLYITEKLVRKTNIFMAIFRFSKNRIIWYWVWICFEEKNDEWIVQPSTQNKKVSSSCVVYSFLLLAYRINNDFSLSKDISNSQNIKAISYPKLIAIRYNPSYKNIILLKFAMSWALPLTNWISS